jgi:membrane carboxypeptidase/penicillin-binding protein PbpC
MKHYSFSIPGSPVVAALFIIILSTMAAQAQTSVSLSVAVKQTACATSVQEPSNNAASSNTSANDNLHIFPNPASNQFMVEWDNGLQGSSVRLSLINTRGEIVWTTEEQSVKSGVWRKAVNTASMAAGAYILTIETNGKKHSRSVVIK